MIYPSAYLHTAFGGIFNPYFGGFGHLNLPQAGAGYLWPAYTYPFNFQPPALFALESRFIA